MIFSGTELLAQLRGGDMRAIRPILLVAALVVAGTAGILFAQAPQQNSGGLKPLTLDIYFVDSEGGQITLFVSPSGESMLVDTGFSGHADRIMSVLKQANVTVLDYVVITHYH